MRRTGIGLFFLMAIGLCLTSCGTSKKKKFLDYFSTYSYDTLTVISTENVAIYIDPATPFQLKGTPIDTSFLDVFSLEEAEDLRYFIPNDVEKGPIAYYKMKLDIGYYLLIIRAAGEYWNSRYYACLYHSGENKVTRTILIAENFGDAGSAFLCSSFLNKVDKTWKIKAHQYYQEPVDFRKYEVDSLYITEIDLEYSISMENDRYYFKEINSKKTTNH